MEWITKITSWKKAPAGDEINKRFEALCMDMFRDTRGQEFLYLLKHKVGYDLNPYTTSQGDRGNADAHEGRKDTVRMIEGAMQRYAVKQDNKENDGKTKES